MNTLKLIVALWLVAVGIVACDGGRYSVARNHVTGEDCYVLDWQKNEKLPATPENVSLAEGDMFWADPQQCR